MARKIISSQLRVNMLSGAATAVLDGLILAISYRVYLDFLGYEKYGLWLALGTIIAFARLGDLGISQALTKLVAEEHGKDDLRAIERYVLTAIVILTCSGLVALVTVFCFRSPIVTLFRFSPEDTRTALWLLPCVGALSGYMLILQAMSACLSGFGRMDLANYVLVGRHGLSLLFAMPFLAGDYGVASLLFGWAIACLVTHMAIVLLSRRVSGLRFLRARNLDAGSAKKLLAFGSGIVSGGVLGMLVDPFNKFMLSRYAGLNAIPVYDIAFRGCQQVRAFSEVGFRALMPEISRIGANWTKEAKGRIAQLNRKALKFLVVFGGAPYAVLFFAAPALLEFWFRESFVDSLPVVFRVVLFGTFLSLLAVPSYYFFLGVGRVRYVFAARLLTAGTNSVLVVATVLSTNELTALRIALSLMVSWALSSGFLLWQHKKFSIRELTS